jgi:quercetin dioxygenase-like cupin family protein
MKIENVLAQIEYNQIQSKRLVTNGEQQVNILSFEEGSEIPSHSSTKDATIVMLEGKVEFTIGGKKYELKAFDTFSFGENDEHSVKATAKAKFLLIQ